MKLTNVNNYSERYSKRYKNGMRCMSFSSVIVPFTKQKSLACNTALLMHDIAMNYQII